MSDPYRPYSLKPYLMRYTLALITGIFAIAIIDMVLNQDGTNGAKMIIPFLAATFAGEHFLKRERRLPSRIERRRLVWTGLAIYVLFEVLLTALAILTGAADALVTIGSNISILIGVIAGLLMLSVLINYVLMNWAYYGLLEKRAKRLGIKLNETFD